MSRRLVGSAWFCVVALIGMLTTGCAFGDRGFSMDYQPVMRLKMDRPLQVHVQSFADERGYKDRRKVGQVRNTYNMETAKVLAEDGGPGDWLAQALRAELTNAGVSVVDQGDQASVVVGGTVKKFFADLTVKGIKVDTCVVFTVRRDGEIVHEQEYIGRENMATLTGTSAEYRKAHREALELVIRRAYPAVFEAIRK